MDRNKPAGFRGDRGSRRPGGGCAPAALGLTLLAAGLCPGWSLAGASAGNSVSLDGLTCRYPARARWLADHQAEPPGGPRRLALEVACDTAMGPNARTAELPALTLLDAAGRPYPEETRTRFPERAAAASKTAPPRDDRSPGLSARIAAPPPGTTFSVRALFALPVVLPAGPWQLQLTGPGRVIQLPLELPSE